MKKWLLITLAVLLMSACSGFQVKDTKFTKDQTPKQVVKANVGEDDDAVVSKKDIKQDVIIFYYKGEEVGKMSVVKFKAVLKGADNYNAVLDAEKNGRIEVHFVKKPWVINKSKGKYKAQLRLIWKDTNKKIIKQVDIDLNMDINSNQFPEWRRMYRNVAEIGFIVTGGMSIVLVLLLILLL